VGVEWLGSGGSGRRVRCGQRPCQCRKLPAPCTGRYTTLCARAKGARQKHRYNGTACQTPFRGTVGATRSAQPRTRTVRVWRHGQTYARKVCARSETTDWFPPWANSMSPTVPHPCRHTGVPRPRTGSGPATVAIKIKRHAMEDMVLPPVCFLLLIVCRLRARASPRSDCMRRLRLLGDWVVFFCTSLARVAVWLQLRCLDRLLFIALKDIVAFYFATRKDGRPAPSEFFPVCCDHAHVFRAVPVQVDFNNGLF